ncbi:MAG: VOC family protein [Sphingomonas sp.]
MHIPPGFTTVFPYIFVQDADAYMAFLADGLGGEVTHVTRGPGERLANGQVKFGDTTVMISEASPAYPPTRGTYYFYVADADAAMARGVAAGGVQHMPVADQPYGDRQGGLSDSQGNIWWISQRLEAGTY